MITRIIDIPDKSSFFLFGARQTGKSTLIHRHFGEKRRVWKIDLLNSVNILKYLKDPTMFRREALIKINNEKIEAIFIDEIQKAPYLLDEVQSLMFDFKDIQFVVTGSSARKLKRGAANLLAGRLFQRFLFPFVHAELGNEFDLENSLRVGTLPSLYQKNESSKIEILNSYVTTYLREEIQAEGITRNLGGFSNFLDVAAAQCGEVVNFSSIARDAGLPSRTVQSYYQILEDTLIAIKLSPWRKSIRKRLVLHPKYYFFDTGVTNAVCGRLSSPPNPILRGRLFEQWVILETFRIISYKRSEIRMYYWRTNTGAEVDLIFERAGKIVAGCEIKSSKNISSADTSGLRSFSDEHPDIPLLIVCNADESFSIGNIEVLPWKKYFIRLEEILK